jgi:hypothetical protein
MLVPYGRKDGESKGWLSYYNWSNLLFFFASILEDALGEEYDSAQLK